jgi:hypothetical protein
MTARARSKQPVSDPGGYDVDAAVGTKAWAERWRLEVCSVASHVSEEPERFERYLKLGTEHRVWTLLTRAGGIGYRTFKEFCEEPQPWGLGMAYEQVEAWLDMIKGKRARLLETVSRAMPGSRTDRPRGQTSAHDEPRLSPATEKRLRAILRAPDSVQDLYREGGISQTVAARLGPKDPTPDQAARVAEVARELRGLKDRKQVDRRVKDMLGEKPPSRVDRIEKMVRALEPAELRELWKRLRAMLDPRTTSKDR